jgi:hypothetical protein
MSPLALLYIQSPKKARPRKPDKRRHKEQAARYDKAKLHKDEGDRVTKLVQDRFPHVG